MSHAHNQSLFRIPRRANSARVIRWSQSHLVYVPITDITKAAPPVITAAGHGLPTGWRFWIESVLGMTNINRPFAPLDGNLNQPYIADSIDSDSLSIRNLNATSYRTYTSGGVLVYKPPQDLDGATATLKIYDSLLARNVLTSFSTDADDGIEIDDTEKTITILTEPAKAADYEFSQGEYELLITIGSETTALATGPVEVEP